MALWTTGSVENYVWNTATMSWVKETQPAGGGVAANVNLYDASGNPISSTAGALDVNISSPNPIPVSLPADTLITGSLSGLNQTVVFMVPPGVASVGLEVTGTWSGQINFQATIDGVNWYSIYGSSLLTAVNAIGGNGIFILPAAGFAQIQVIAYLWNSGTANISFNGSIGSTTSVASAPLPAGTNTIGNVNVNNGALETGGNLATLVSEMATLTAAVVAGGTGTPAGAVAVQFFPQKVNELQTLAVNVSSLGLNQIIAASGSQTIRIYRLLLVAATPVVLTIPSEGIAGVLTGPMTISTMVLDYQAEPWFTMAAGEAFNLYLGSAVQVSGTVWYTQQ